MEIWTIGHFSHAIETFAELLTQRQIKILVDIRRFPGSRTFSQFNRETLGPSLDSHDIEYLWLKSLGGRRSESYHREGITQRRLAEQKLSQLCRPHADRRVSIWRSRAC